MIRVLHVIESACVGGAQRALQTLALGLRRREVGQIVALPFDGPLRDRLRAAGIACFELPIDRRLDRRTGEVVAELVRRSECSIVHAHTPKAGMLARPAAKRAGAKVVMSVRGLGNRALLETPGYPLLERLKKRCLVALESRADQFTDVFILECERDIARGHYPREKVRLIHNGIDPEEYPFLPPSDRPVLLFPARLSVQKDPATFVRAAAILAGRGVEFEAWIGGGGEGREELGRLARELGVESRVVFLDGRLGGSELFREAAITVLTTHFEGMAFAVLESMSSGRPVVASDVGGIAEALSDTGIAVPPRDPEAVADAVEGLLHDPERRREMATRARRRLVELYSAERNVEAHLALYRELAG